ncbi:MAG: DNA-directed RNA polymerase subunit D [Candidatus Woesearchaeota archaeon]
MEFEIKKYDSENGKIYAIFKDVNSAFLNALRKYILSEVPTMAIDEVTFYKNNTGMYDEMIALRLGLIPLKSDIDNYLLPEKCDCPDKNCARCSVEVFVKKKGPGVLYAKDLEFTDPAVKPVFPDMEIVKLDHDQEIEFTGYVRLGKGKVHAKHSPGFCYYRHLAKIIVNNDKSLNKEEISKYCPKKVFDSNLKVINPEECDLCNKCVELSDNKIVVEPIEDQFFFYLESFGQLTIKRILKEAIQKLNEDLDNFSDLF